MMGARVGRDDRRHLSPVWAALGQPDLEQVVVELGLVV